MADDDQQSLITSPPDSSDIIVLLDEAKLQGMLQEHLTPVVELVTGALATGKTGLAVSVGRGVQGLLKHRSFRQFGQEFRALRDKGKIPNDFADKKHGFQTWVELMTIIDEECPDEERLEALKAMFYAVNKVTSGDKTTVLAYQLWQIARRLRSGELLLLKAMKGFGCEPGYQYQAWANHIAQSWGGGTIELVHVFEEPLIDLHLIAALRDADGIYTNHRLTALGQQFCANLETYKIDLKAAMDASD